MGSNNLLRFMNEIQGRNECDEDAGTEIMRYIIHKIQAEREKRLRQSHAGMSEHAWMIYFYTRTGRDEHIAGRGVSKVKITPKRRRMVVHAFESTAEKEGMVISKKGSVWRRGKGRKGHLYVVPCFEFYVACVGSSMGCKLV